MSRAQVRQYTQAWFDPLGDWTDPPDGLDKVWTSFPVTIDYRTYVRIKNISTRAQLVVFITGQDETRESIGGEHQGWKSVDYDVVIDIYCQSVLPDPTAAMADIDTLIDTIHDRATADHTFAQPSTVIFMAAEPSVTIRLGEPVQNDAGATIQWAQMSFTVTQKYQA